MATDPSFAATPNTGHALLGAAETNLQVPTTAATIITAGTSGTKIESITVSASQTSLVATTVAGLVYVFIHDGTNYRLFDEIVVTAITASATVQCFRQRVSYPDLFLKSGESLRMSQSIAGNANLLVAHAFGGDL